MLMYAWRRGWQIIGSIYTARFSWSINIMHRENLHVVRKIFMVNQTHQENLVHNTFSWSIKRIWWNQFSWCRKSFRYGIENNWESNSEKIKRNTHTCSETQRLPEDTSDALLYFLTTCTALCHCETLKCMLMSFIIDKGVSRKHRHRRKLPQNHLLWLPTLQQLDAADTIALYIITFDD